jgi:hypothetical protein
MSVCDVLMNPALYSGQVVGIRAFLSSSGGDTDFDELAPMESERCYRPRRDDDRRIGITAADHHFLENPAKNWKPNLRSFQRAEKSLEEIVKKDPQVRQVLVTVEGIVYDGGPSPRGVTRNPWYPATIVVSNWKEIKKP